MGFLGRTITTHNFISEAKRIGKSMSKDPAGRAGYYIKGVNHYSESGDANDNRVVALQNKIRDAVKNQFDEKTQSDWDVLIYPKFDFNRKYIGFELKLRF